jgi:iron complex transport system ATP-binding protein
VVTNGGNAGPTAGIDPTPAISLANVSVGYRGTPVVTGVSLEVPVGGWLSIIGPNGAGKSTVLKAIVGVLVYEGMLEVDGVAQTKGSSARAVGYVPQKPVLPPGMTTAEYALLGRTAHLGWFGSESGGDRDRVADVFDRLDMAHLASRPIIELSGGEAQRAALARALVQEASVLVLDEPTSALDLANQIGVLELVNELRHEQGLAVISGMHDLSMAGRFSDQLALLAGGTVAAHGSPEDVLTEDILSLHYRTPVSVMRGPDDQLVVVPLRTGATVSSAAANRPTSHDRNNGEVDV